ncbi:unnamed protein product [Macrosiphum euphorbiae]|uniref:Uncharacterized protein n=1 Tax=Macrosiphum euphorbiae TaxID=13131 RepID=A0AAV0WSV1_9HEMI|nr:unnamed protein product [Macrosiphum euphorbiae]
MPICARLTLEKLPTHTVFHVHVAGYWSKFSTSNNLNSDAPHWLRYCHCTKLKIPTIATRISVVRTSVQPDTDFGVQHASRPTAERTIDRKPEAPPAGLRLAVSGAVCWTPAIGVSRDPPGDQQRHLSVRIGAHSFGKAVVIMRFVTYLSYLYEHLRPTCCRM